MKWKGRPLDLPAERLPDEVRADLGGENVGLFGWLKRLLGGREELVRRFAGGQECPYCGVRLWSPNATWCHSCQADWSDPNNVVRTRRPRNPPPSRSSSPPPRTVLPDVDVSSGGANLTFSTTVAPAETGSAGTSGGRARNSPANTSIEGLDAEQFAPITRDELKRGTGWIGSLWSNPWMGRRDLIPPTSDSRTLLIDRAMVAHGILTPEDLVEIHEVGLEMDRVRPDLAAAAERAEAAVARSQQEREELKRRKKEEAEERRRRRAEEVAHRRATDIVFLGRGVSRDLADRRANVEKLHAAGLPVLSTPADVAAALELTIPRLRWLAWHGVATPSTHYVAFTVPKKDGGVRRLAAPRAEMRRCQRWILESVLSRIPVHKAAHGFVPTRSTVTNAVPHVGKDVVVNTDLEDFFPTITFPRVSGLFRSIGYSPAAATILALLCTECPRRLVEYDGDRLHVAVGERQLPQGACTSPALSNLVARRLDARLDGISRKLGWTYTRYADDCTFSTSGEPSEKVGYLLARIRHIADDEGFRVKESKTRVLRRSTAQSVTGIVVNERPGVRRRTVRRLRAILHDARRNGLDAANREGHPNFTAWLRGMIAYVSMVNPRQAEPLQRELDLLVG